MSARPSPAASFYSYSTKRNLRQEELAAYRRIGLATFIIVSLLVGGYFWGIPLLSHFGAESTAIPVNNNALGTTDTLPPSPPNIDSQPDITRIKTITIAGSAESGSNVTVSNNQQVEFTTLVDKAGLFQGQVKLIGGTNTITAIAVDKAGNKSRVSKSLTIQYDATPPKLLVSSPTDDQTTSSTSSFKVSGKTDPAASVTINDRQAIVQDDGTFSLTLSLQAGANTITITSTDQAGNIAKLIRTVNLATTPAASSSATLSN